MIYNRKSGYYIEEIEDNEKTLDFLYNTMLGRIILKIVINPYFSKKMAKYYKSRKSKKKILPFIKKFNIDVSDIDINAFNNFNDFFTRKKEFNFQGKKDVLIAVAESKLSVYKIRKNSLFKIKNSIYSVEDILQSKELSNRYMDGCLLIFRLTTDNLHRFIYIDNGNILKKYKIKGVLHTVRSISSKYKVFKHNSREITVMNTQNFGSVTQVEVGALTVGKIINHTKESFKKGEEKGYFEFGGSTIILFFEPDKIIIDDDILKQSKNGIETEVQIGETIGKAL